MNCNHEWIDVGFSHTREVCKHCDLLKADYDSQQVEYDNKSLVPNGLPASYQGFQRSTPQSAILPSQSSQQQPFHTGDTVRYSASAASYTIFTVDICHWDPFLKEWRVKDKWGNGYAAKYCTLVMPAGSGTSGSGGSGGSPVPLQISYVWARETHDAAYENDQTYRDKYYDGICAMPCKLVPLVQHVWFEDSSDELQSVFDYLIQCEKERRSRGYSSK